MEYARGFEGEAGARCDCCWMRRALDISDEACAADGETRAAAACGSAQERTDSEERMLFHKTTQRALYARASGERRWREGSTMRCS